MREIKFRAFLTEEKRMVQVGSLMTMPDEEFVRIWPLGEDPKKNYRVGKNCEILQYSGITDKNGIGIHFNSDLVLVKMTRRVDKSEGFSYSQTEEDGSKRYFKIEMLPCTLNNESFPIYFWCHCYGLKKPLWVMEEDLKNLEVIGNIHDNPELIEKQKVENER